MKNDTAVSVLERGNNKLRLRMKNILVPTDFSEASLPAVEHAQGLAALFGARLHMVHVVPTLVPPEAATDVSRLVKDAEKQFTQFLSEANIAKPTERAQVLYGDLLGELNDFVGDNEIDLVVISSNARQGASRLVLGSMAEYIFRGLQAPVLVIGPQVAEPLSPSHPIKRILLCESLEPDAASAMNYGCSLAKDLDASVTVMHTLPASLKDSSHAHLFQRMFEEELRTLGTQRAQFAHTDFLITFGDTAQEVVRVAKSMHADLIVVGAKPAEMWQTHMARGTAYRILANGHCPILSVGSTSTT